MEPSLTPFAVDVTDRSSAVKGHVEQQVRFRIQEASSLVLCQGIRLILRFFSNPSRILACRLLVSRCVSIRIFTKLTLTNFIHITNGQTTLAPGPTQRFAGRTGPLNKFARTFVYARCNLLRQHRLFPPLLQYHTSISFAIYGIPRNRFRAQKVPSKVPAVSTIVNTVPSKVPAASTISPPVASVSWVSLHLEHRCSRRHARSVPRSHDDWENSNE